MPPEGSRIDWNDVARRYPIGANVTGRVKHVWQVGAIIQLEPGLVGMVLHNEMSWDGPVPDARLVLHVGDAVRAQVLQVESWHNRVVLSIRRAAHDPWLIFNSSSAEVSHV